MFHNNDCCRSSTDIPIFFACRKELPSSEVLVDEKFAWTNRVCIEDSLLYLDVLGGASGSTKLRTEMLDTFELGFGHDEDCECNIVG